MQSKLKKRFEDFQKNLDTISIKSNYVDVIAVSKKQSIEKIKILNALGIKKFGENYAQELSQKAELLKESNLEWHFIGPIQSNKCDQIVKHSSLIHSVAREKIVKCLNKAANKFKKVQKVLIQVNIENEPTKSGVQKHELKNFIDLVNDHKNLELHGLMFLPDISKNDASQLQTMQECFELFSTMKKYSTKLEKLSLGTSQDFEKALKQGSNMIRVGEILFGPRP